MSTDTPTDADLIAAIGRGIADGSIIEVTDEWLAAQRAELAAEEDSPEAPRTLGPIPLTHESDDGWHAEQWWGVNPHNGDAVFISRDRVENMLRDEQSKPWTAKLWIGWEDGARAGHHRSDGDRFATFEEAREAVRRRCVGWYRYLGDTDQAAEFLA